MKKPALIAAGLAVALAVCYLAIAAIDRQPSLSDTFNRIYADGAWGKDTTGTGASGTGSTVEITREYRAFVEDFMKKHAVTSVVDAGSGDWGFSSAIDWGNTSYLGIDIASDVISAVRKKHETGRIRFQVGDITDDLPAADLLISKDVLQHLSNELVHAFIRNNLRKGKYKWAILTNDRSGPRQNLDIQPGGHRPLDLAAPPFGVKGLVDLPIAFGAETAKVSSLLELAAIP